MSEESGNNPLVIELSHSFSEAHRRYLRAHIDLTFKTEILIPLQAALHKYEVNEREVYSGNTSLDTQLFLLRLKSVSLLVEGFYWIGSFEEAEREIHRYAEVEGLLTLVVDKQLKDILFNLSQLPQMKNAEPILRKMIRNNKAEFLQEQKRIIREVIRIGVNIAVLSYYNNHLYERAACVLEICYKLAEAISSDDFHPYGLLGQIDYFTGCCLRQINRLNDSEKKFTQVLDHYLHRINIKFKKYILTKESEENWESFRLSAGLSRYRTAITLMARSDLNRRRGNLRIALYQNLAVARIILGETKDTVNRAYARMLYAIISREMYGNLKSLLEALEMIKLAEKDFSEMEHHKYKLRSTFERAYTLYYLARFYSGNDVTNKESADCVNEALAILEKLKEGADQRWLAQYLTLESRLLIIIGDLDQALAVTNQAISLLDIKYSHKTYLVEALIAKSRVLMEKFVRSIRKSHQSNILNEAKVLLERAQRENRNADGTPENNKIEAIINFALAGIKVRQRDQPGAEECLRAGLKHLPFIESEGVGRLYEFARREVSRAKLTFDIVNDLDMDSNKEALERFILEHAIKDAKKLGKEPWKVLNKGRATFFNLLKKHGLKWR